MKAADFVQLLRESVITQAAITIITILATVYLLLVGRPVPGELWSLCGLVVGFYFGGKVQAQAMRLARAEAHNMEADDDGGEGRAAPRRRTKD
jgi:hypothetical protein